MGTYHLVIYPKISEVKKPKYDDSPHVGDLLHVESIDKDVLDIHYGACVVVELSSGRAPIKESHEKPV